jgi:prepilin signal peptidase PulO-like enzyme (type II secretory pathway)
MIAYLDTSLLVYFFVFIFGAIIGSFLNCLIYRLHSGESMWGRSHCFFCQKQIAWYDNAPLLSYLMLLGKCRHCRKHFSLQYFLVELFTGLLFVLVAWARTSNLQFEIYNLQFTISLLRDLFVVAVMVIVFIYDLRWYLILDKVMIPAIIVIALFDVALAFFAPEPFYFLLTFLFSGIIGGGFFLVQYLVSKGRWIGGGDIRLGLLMGLILGWPAILTALCLAYLSGASIGLALIAARQKELGSRLPFGVFLSVATVVALLFSPVIVEWYLDLSFY